MWILGLKGLILNDIICHDNNATVNKNNSDLCLWCITLKLTKMLVTCNTTKTDKPVTKGALT